MPAAPRHIPPSGDLASYSDTVLYDVFFEAGTQLGALLVRLERAALAAGDTDQASRWHDRSLAVDDERDKVRATDRTAQIATLTRWRSEMDRLATQRST